MLLWKSPLHLQIQLSKLSTLSLHLFYQISTDVINIGNPSISYFLAVHLCLSALSFANVLIVWHYPIMVKQLMNMVSVLRTTQNSPKTIPNPQHFRSITFKPAGQKPTGNSSASKSHSFYLFKKLQRSHHEKCNFYLLNKVNFLNWKLEQKPCRLWTVHSG